MQVPEEGTKSSGTGVAGGYKSTDVDGCWEQIPGRLREEEQMLSATEPASLHPQLSVVLTPIEETSLCNKQTPQQKTTTFQNADLQSPDPADTSSTIQLLHLRLRGDCQGRDSKIV